MDFGIAMNEQVFQKAIGLLPEIRADILRRVPVELQGFIGLEMNRTNITIKNNKPVISKTKNTTNILNVRTGNLSRSFTKGNENNILEDTSTGIKFGSMVKYAAIHEYGNPSRNMPKRSYLQPAIKAFEEQALEQLVIKAMQPIKNLFT